MPPRFSRKAEHSGTAPLSRPLSKINKLIRTILCDADNNPSHDVFADDFTRSRFTEPGQKLFERVLPAAGVNLFIEAKPMDTQNNNAAKK